MSSRSPACQSFSTMANEHRELTDLFTKLTEAVLRDGQGKGPVEELIEVIADRIQTHFQHEENGGYFTAIIERAPRLMSRAEQLVEQHASILEQVEMLRILVRSGVESPAWWNRIRSDLNALQLVLSQHERAEEELVKEAFGGEHAAR
ncbi:MAG: hypothetical protein KDA57_13185 [Planctomycetales bacterium]|nr:hypothetical protein [Planctomycetales bacterium]